MLPSQHVHFSFVYKVSATKHRLHAQMSNDVRMLLPTLVGIMVAKVRAAASDYILAVIAARLCASREAARDLHCPRGEQHVAG